MRVSIVDYGVGNIASLQNALQSLGAEVTLCNAPTELSKASHVILPGVGNYTHCAHLLAELGWFEIIRELSEVHQVPLLGICVGMQLLFDNGFEGASDDQPTEGLGLISGSVKSMRGLGCEFRLPHVGWNSICIERENQLLAGIPTGADFYFVHSYCANAGDREVIFASCKYGINFPALVNRRNVWGTQFHPEKSSRSGLKVLENFLKT